ncbi:hypothetical protein NDK43_18665 [Neobacillus pocheonensis]|uniref:Uncharacterized protein n=1 Tax=Neobacillus pocheonensis TaxID=363869 RepID=A0ABT0WCG3_9BACI|nr:hypothetical protein [Neobacillus pocheonensis]
MSKVDIEVDLLTGRVKVTDLHQAVAAGPYCKSNGVSMAELDGQSKVLLQF